MSSTLAFDHSYDFSEQEKQLQSVYREYTCNSIASDQFLYGLRLGFLGGCYSFGGLLQDLESKEGPST